MDNNVAANNAFVKAQQAKMKSKMGNRPGVKPEFGNLNANMMIDGDYAEACAKRITAGMDADFPVK